MAGPLAALTGRFPALESALFRRWWGGYLVSISGQQMLWMTEGWLIYELSGSKVLLGVNGLLQAVPATIASMLGGAIADRFDQRRLLLGIQAAAMTVLGVIAFLCFSGLVEVWHVMAASFLLSAINAFEQPARQSMFPALVDRTRLPSAVGLNGTVHPGTRMVAPVIGGFVLDAVLGGTGSAAFAGGAVFCLTAAGMAAYAVTLWGLRVPPSERAPRGGVLAATFSGVGFVARNRIFAALIGAMYFNTFFGLAMNVLYPVMAKDVLGMGPSGLGVMYMAQGIGSLMGALGAAGWATERGQGRLLVAGAVGLGVGVSVFALSSWVALSLPALWLAGVGGSTFSVSVQSSIQLLVPDAFRGRVMAVWSMTHSSVRPVGELWFGMAAAVLTAPVALSLSGAAVLGFALLIALPRRGLRTLRVGVER